MDDSLLEMYGVKRKKEKEESPLKPKTCSICNTVNQATFEFCGKCARPLDAKAMMKLEEKREKDRTLSLKLINTDGVIEKFMENANEDDITELMEAHPNIAPKLHVITIQNIRQQNKI